MNPSPRAVTLVQEFEGCRLEAYQDVRGIWTIGYGHTGGIQAHQCITQQQADEFLAADLETASKPLQALCELTQMEFDALTSFIFNVGAGAFSTSTLRRKISAADFRGAALEFGKWVFAGGQEVPGLVRRRAAEQALFQSTP